MLAGKKATCHPGFSSKLADQRWGGVAVVPGTFVKFLLPDLLFFVVLLRDAWWWMAP
jgi:hypothetical protein